MFHSCHNTVMTLNLLKSSDIVTHMTVTFCVTLTFVLIILKIWVPQVLLSCLF